MHFQLVQVLHSLEWSVALKNMLQPDSCCQIEGNIQGQDFVLHNLSYCNVHMQHAIDRLSTISTRKAS